MKEPSTEHGERLLNILNIFGYYNITFFETKHITKEYATIRSARTIYPRYERYPSDVYWTHAILDCVMKRFHKVDVSSNGGQF